MLIIAPPLQVGLGFFAAFLALPVSVTKNQVILNAGLWHQLLGSSSSLKAAVASGAACSVESLLLHGCLSLLGIIARLEVLSSSRSVGIIADREEKSRLPYRRRYSEPLLLWVAMMILILPKIARMKKQSLSSKILGIGGRTPHNCYT
jgi:hypothetical protein